MIYLEELAETAYEAYRRSCKGKSIRGEELPHWKDLPDAIQTHWRAAASAVHHILITTKRVVK